MFGTNEIVGKAFFKNAPKDSLFVTSIFFTLQGEGPHSGKACVFVRLAKCQLACKFCDTLFDTGQWMTYDEILERAAALVPRPFKEIGMVFTGGEPTLQDNLVEFSNIAWPMFNWVQTETNGLITQTLMGDVVVSPKVSEKSGHYLKPTDYMLEDAVCLKFVMSADQSSPYSQIPEWALAMVKDVSIYVSPMNVYNQVPQKIRLLRQEKTEVSLEERSTVDEVISFWEPGLLNMEQNRLNHEYAARYALKHNLRFNLQAHLYAGLA